MKEHLLNDIKDIKKYWAKTYQKWADKIQIGDYINCSDVISASTKKNHSIRKVNYYQITDIQLLNDNNKKLLIKAVFYSKDFDDIPKKTKMWHYDDVIKFADLDLPEKETNPTQTLYY